jgi:threonine synthase
MEFISTRGGKSASFEEVLLGGLAPDGGLYLPRQWPAFGADEIRDFASLGYAEAAVRVLSPLTTDTFSADELRTDASAAYAPFSHGAVAPLVQLEPDVFLLELFHGPTLAFKDLALQLMARLFARALARRGNYATIVAATSGDTGSAAISAFRGQPGVQVIVLHPKNRISEIQRRQMTTVTDRNVHNIALEGDFDDAQAIVKRLFQDDGFRTHTNLTAVNSINLVRILAQSVYYFTAAAALGAGFGRTVHFVVPTGNFGDVFAGEAAARMGLSVGRLVIGTNVNDILVRALATGVYGAADAVQPTLSPSMDIQVASNFERALFEASGRDAHWMMDRMSEFAKTRRLAVPKGALNALRERYLAAKAEDDETLSTIRSVWEKAGMIVDPHTAVGLTAYCKARKDISGPVIAFATAHPAKFPDVIAKAIGRTAHIPRALAGLAEREERYSVLPNSVAAVKQFILEHTGQT